MTSRISPAVSRREFVRTATATVLVTTVPLLGSCGDGTTGSNDDGDGTTLRVPATMSGSGTLLAVATSARVSDDLTVAAWTLNGVVPSPTIRVRRGDAVQLQLVNQLPQPTILHWHGLLVPADADGHPRDIIEPGSQYAYNFPVVQRAGTYWYHPHAHHHTAEQVHRGIAGFFIISDDEEDALDLPRGAHEILMMLQDRDDAMSAPFEFAPTTSDHHHGMLRPDAYGNGVPHPVVYLPPRRCRLRIVNASHARVYHLTLGSGIPLTIIGNDGGLLPSAITTDSVWLGVGERIDCIVDLGPLAAGNRVMLRSLPFDIAGSSTGSHAQGTPLDVLELVRRPGNAVASPPLPATLSSIPALPSPVATQHFVFTSESGGTTHRINGSVYAVNRTDTQLPLNQVERWEFQNDSALPHPVHLHGTQFQVASRTGGRGVVFDYERGWKDTVLVMPLETVAVHVRFDAYAGTYLLHCHNLQHEDMGMMLNVDVT